MSPALNSDFAAARQAMIDSQLRPLGVTDPQVLGAMASVPREAFVPPAQASLAYADRSVPLGEGKALAPPAALGLLLDALLPVAGERALVVANGSGYSAAVLEALGLAVTNGDSDPKSWAAGAPYDLILLDGAVEFIPETLIAQLSDNGRLGGALIEHSVSRLVIGRKVGGAFGLRSIGDAAMPRLPGFARPQAFTF